MRDYTARFIQIPMRDGIELGAVLYLPSGAGRVPAVMEMTPYLADNAHSIGVEFAREGLAFVAVDCRGRGGSGGEFMQWRNDGPDGFDAVQWIAEQAWCDGQVGLFGGSYTGWNQWSIADQLPPALKTIVPSAAFMGGVDIPHGGVGSPYMYRWRVTLKGHHISWNLAADTLIFNRIQGDLYRRHGSLLEVPGVIGFEAPGWEDDLVATGWGPIWEARRPSPESLRRLDIPVLSLTGMYDTCLPGTLTHHRRYDEHGGEKAQRQNYLIIGPWDHRGMRGTDRVYALQFGPAAKIDLYALKRRWYRWVFGMGDKPAFLDARVKHYLCEADEWRGADSLDALCGAPKPLFLASDGHATDIFRSGWLADAAADTPADSFVSDPFDFRPLETESRLSRSPELDSHSGAIFPRAYNSLFFIQGGEDPTNAVFCHNTFGQGVIYHSAPLEAPIDLVGEPELRLWLSCDAPDADLCVLLYEVLEDGSTVFLSSDLLRLRHRDGSTDGVPMPSATPTEVRFRNFRFATRRLLRHSRIRLVVRATACSFMQKNLNSATAVHLQKPEEARVARIEVLHDRAHPAALMLPIVK